MVYLTSRVNIKLRADLLLYRPLVLRFTPIISLDWVCRSWLLIQKLPTNSFDSAGHFGFRLPYVLFIDTLIWLSHRIVLAFRSGLRLVTRPSVVLNYAHKLLSSRDSIQLLTTECLHINHGLVHWLVQVFWHLVLDGNPYDGFLLNLWGVAQTRRDVSAGLDGLQSWSLGWTKLGRLVWFLLALWYYVYLLGLRQAKGWRDVFSVERGVRFID